MAGYGLSGYSWITFDHWIYIGFACLAIISVYKQKSLPLKEFYLVDGSLKDKMIIFLNNSVKDK